MIFCGISKVFSTENNHQYESIGKFWEDQSKRYGISNLRGLGYHWTEKTIEYVIGLKQGIIDNANCSVEFPDDNWISVSGKTSDLERIYEKIYSDGSLIYEIEMFTENGECQIQYYR